MNPIFRCVFVVLLVSSAASVIAMAQVPPRPSMPAMMIPAPEPSFAIPTDLDRAYQICQRYRMMTMPGYIDEFANSCSKIETAHGTQVGAPTRMVAKIVADQKRKDREFVDEVAKELKP